MQEQDKRISITNISERKNRLPIGILKGNELKRDFSLREMTYPIEKAIGKFKAGNEGLPNTAVISKMLSLMVSNIGGHEWNFQPSDDADADALIEVGQLFLADVYYIYVMTRIQELGPIYETQFDCSLCGFNGKVKIDLTSMNVTVVNDPSVLRREVPLLKGIDSPRFGGVKKKVCIQPMLWANMTTNEIREASGDPSLIKLHFIKHCIVGVEGMDEAIHLSEAELETLRKIDIEKIASAINAINIGPSLIIDSNCPNCKVPFLNAMDWDYESFFTISSP